MTLTSLLRPNTPPRWTFVLGLLAVAVALGLSIRAGLFEFCSFDDPSYVSSNMMVQAKLSWKGVLAAFSFRQAMYWHPLTTLSFMLDYQVFRLWAGGYHVVNVAWHCGNVALLFLLVLRLTESRAAAALAGLLFAVHPAHVESVAWISERKDVLSTFFGLAAIILYIRTARRPSVPASLCMYASYALSLMAKPAFVIMPGLLLLVDFWPLGRLEYPPHWRRVAELLREKLLFIAFGAVVTFMTFATHAKTQDRLDPDLWLKLANAAASIGKYLVLLVWPHDMAIVYPFPDAVPAAQVLAGTAALVGITALCLWQARRRPYLLFGWLWFLAGLTPVIMPPKFGLHVAMADRWTYVPFMGIYLALGMLLAEGLQRVSRVGRAALVAVCLIVLIALGVAQQRQLDVWETPATLYEQALRVTTGNYMAQNNYGVLLMGQGKMEEAEHYFHEALRSYPEFALVKLNLGALLLHRGNVEEALGLMWAAVPGMGGQRQAYDAYRGIAMALDSLGQMAEAEHFLAAAVRENPRRSEAFMEWGRLAHKRGDTDFAHEFFRQMSEDGSSVGTFEDLRQVMRSLGRDGSSPANPSPEHSSPVQPMGGAPDVSGVGKSASAKATPN